MSSEEFFFFSIDHLNEVGKAEKLLLDILGSYPVSVPVGSCAGRQLGICNVLAKETPGGGCASCSPPCLCSSGALPSLRAGAQQFAQVLAPSRHRPRVSPLVPQRVPGVRL